jgi:hypothetical protein
MAIDFEQVRERHQQEREDRSRRFDAVVTAMKEGTLKGRRVRRAVYPEGWYGTVVTGGWWRDPAGVDHRLISVRWDGQRFSERMSPANVEFVGEETGSDG